jgi:hypothetical protein
MIDADDLRDPAIRRALDKADAALRAASNIAGKQAIIANCVVELDHLGDDGSDPIGDLSDKAIDVFGVPVADVQEALKRGREFAWTHPEPAPIERGQGAAVDSVRLDDFYAHMPTHSYIFVPTRQMWPSASVNARLPSIEIAEPGGKPKLISASRWLDSHRSVEETTWAPGMPMVIRDRLISDGGWIERDGVATFNLYRPPPLICGRGADAGRWIEHAHKVFGDDATHIIRWFAHRAQLPQQKINHALVLGGHQGIGKDSLLEPVKRAIGAWNFREVSPQQLLSRFNGFLKSVILRAFRQSTGMIYGLGMKMADSATSPTI